MGCLRMGMAVSGFQPLKSPAIVIVCAPGALAGLRVNSTLNGRVPGFSTVGGGWGVGGFGGGDISVGVVGLGEEPGGGVGAVLGQKK